MSSSLHFALILLIIPSLVFCRPPRRNVDVGDSNILKVEKLKPADHLDGVKFERDGELNKDFHKEAFMGDHEEIDDDTEDLAEAKLQDIFHKVDTSADGELSIEEMEYWILDKINEHFDQARDENDRIFNHLDPDGDGHIHWKEYYKHFLLAKGHDPEKADQHIETYDVIEMKEDEKDQLVRYKFKWTDADQKPVDNRLNKEEFMSFRHPELSSLMMDNMLNTIIRALDTDNDDILTEEEFTALSPGEVDDETQKQMDRDWQEERRKEFRNTIDTDHDGKATKQEMLAYADPRNPQQAKNEAANLISLIDDNKDKKLSLKEVMAHKEVFIGSKLCNVKKILHDEF